jgi:hypothetical protein
MATLITKNSSTASSIPTAGQLTAGELAVNTADKRVFTKNAAGVVIETGINPSSLTTSSATITGGTVNNTVIGATTPLAGSFTTLSATGAATVGAGLAVTGALSATGALTTAGIKEDSAGNLGLGVVPSAWAANAKAIQNQGGALYAGSASNVILGQNFYNNLSAINTYVTTNAASFYQQSGGSHSWGIAPSGTAGAAVSFTQAMTLDSAGNLLVGATSGSARGYFLQNGVGSSIQTGQNYASFAGTAVNIRVSRDTSNGTYNFIGCTRDGVADVLFVRDSGNVVNTNNSYGAFSDIKLKENITDASPKLAQLNKVRVVNYNLKTEPKHKQLGVVAQELEAIFPGMVEESPDREEQTKTREVEVYAVEEVKDEDGNVTTKAFPATTRTEEYTEQVDLGTVTKTVKYSVFVPMLIKAMQEQQAMIEALTDRLTALETK